MKGLVCPAYGPPSVLRMADLDDLPAPGAGMVAVRTLCAGINYPDLLSIAGTYPIPSEPPFVPGVEGAGRVEALGPGSNRLAVGDLVCWQDNGTKGAFAESVILPETCLARVPPGVDPTVAACIPTAYGTATFALDHRARLQAGETVLVHGASGGVGLAAAQIAMARGARVIATSRSPDKLARLAALGVQTAATGPDLRDRLLEMTGGRGVDVVFDPVGGDLFDVSLRLLAPYGRLLVIGFTSGQFGVARSNILLVKAISVIGVNYGHYLRTEPDAARRTVEHVLDQVAARQLYPEVEVLDGLSCVTGALERLEQGGVFGKLAIRL